MLFVHWSLFICLAENHHEAILCHCMVSVAIIIPCSALIFCAWGELGASASGPDGEVSN